MGPGTTPPTPGLHDDVDEAELRCLHCDYSLVGLSEARCPECGTPFNRAELIDVMCRPDQPLPFGHSQGQRTSAVQIARACLLEPARLGRDLPGRPDITAAIGYGTSVRMVSLAAFATAISIANEARDAVLFFVAALWLGILTYVCELVIAVLLTAGVVPRNVPRAGRFRFWRTMCYCFTTYMLCTFGLLSAYVAFMLLSRETGFTILGLYGIPIAVIVWWWYALGRAIMIRGLPSIWRPMVVASIPVIGVACIALAAFFTAWTLRTLGIL